jgi:hypothetical protein
MLKTFLLSFSSLLRFEHTSTFTIRKIKRLSPSESRLKKLEIERYKLRKIVRQEKIVSLKLSIVNVLLLPLEKLESDLIDNKKRLMNAGSQNSQKQILERSPLPVQRLPPHE